MEPRRSSQSTFAVTLAIPHPFLLQLCPLHMRINSSIVLLFYTETLMDMVLALTLSHQLPRAETIRVRVSPRIEEQHGSLYQGRIPGIQEHCGLGNIHPYNVNNELRALYRGSSVRTWVEKCGPGSNRTELLPGLLRTNQNRDSRSSRTSYWWAKELGCDLACEHPVQTRVDPRI